MIDEHGGRQWKNSAAVRTSAVEESRDNIVAMGVIVDVLCNPVREPPKIAQVWVLTQSDDELAFVHLVIVVPVETESERTQREAQILIHNEKKSGNLVPSLALATITD
eukprot:SAG31_NODE_1238_length_9176_cov_9.589181_6_plen_108_part_00